MIYQRRVHGTFQTMGYAGRYVRLLAISQPELDQDLYSLATQASTMLDKMHPGGKIIEGVSS